MAKYISITGSLICSEAHIKIIKEVINSYENRNDEFALTKEEMNLYQSCWNFQNPAVNWSRYIYYGADIKSYAISLIKSQIETIFLSLEANIPDFYENKIDGIFYLRDNEDEKRITLWLINDNVLTEINRAHSESVGK